LRRDFHFVFHFLNDIVHPTEIRILFVRNVFGVRSDESVSFTSRRVQGGIVEFNDTVFKYFVEFTRFP